MNGKYWYEYIKEHKPDVLGKDIIDYVEQLKLDKETPTLKDAFIAGYKKRALMSGLKYDEVSELSAITNFKCWKSFDLNL
tara:strand:- start:141 stop:380 length:240 start_codon:yes stop_codon:yes gene_type:complete